MIRIPVRTPSYCYEAIIERGVLSRAGGFLKEVLDGVRPLFIVSVAPVRRRWGKTLVRSLEAAGFTPRLAEMPDGEPWKRLSTVEILAERLLHLGADRKAVVLAFGGGVVGDLAGMLASIYMRGVKLVQVPTTVQAQLDAAIGGKTGVNLRAGKNLVGTFYQPQLVLIDPAMLDTLPEREFRAGMYEALKCGIIGRPELFSRLENSSLDALRQDPEFLTWVLAESVGLKAEVVRSDETERDRRRVLNLGHTVGHALEAATGYRRFLHGEAVAWGMQAAARIALETGLLKSAVHARIASAVRTWGSLPPITVETRRVLRYLEVDKKTEAGVVHFILPREIGKVEIRNNVPPGAIVAAMAEIRQASRRGGAE
ncbi:MAG: 3-dehydroquinate synthase [Acidobacteria bacterium]|nr:3-dehydroquinate synthase [Acidobacteriota bacterium]